MILEETFTLNSSVAIPKLALGTWLIDDAVVADAMHTAGGLPDYGASSFFPVFGGKL